MKGPEIQGQTPRGLLAGASRVRKRVLYRNPQWTYAALTAVAGVFLMIFFGLPLTRILKQAFFSPTFTWVHFHEIFNDPHGLYLGVFLTTFRVAATVTLLCLVLGYPMAALLLLAKGRLRQALLICILLPFWTSVLVRTYAWMILLGKNGLVNALLVGIGIIEQPVQLIFNTTGAVIGMTHVMLPYMIFPLYSVMRNIDSGIMRAAYNLGAKPWQAFLKVFLPLTLPGIYAGGLIVFVISLGFFITPALMGGQKDIMVAVLIERQVMETLEWGLSAGLSLILLVATLLLTLIMRRFSKVRGIFEQGG